MRTRFGRTTAWIVAALVAGAGLMAGTALAASPKPSAPMPELAWKSCGDGFECATARVPRDYARPGDGSLSLAVIRKPATGKGKRLGSVFTNPGGPGGSGVDFLRAAAPIFAGVNDRFDIVSWDPRGTAGSGPIDCLTPAQRDARWPATPAFPTIADLPVLAGQAQELIDGCLAADEDGDLPSFTTENTVRDLDLLRRAVGDRKLTYLGFSYGTYIGATYATLFPRRSRALVLDGAIDPLQYARAPLENLFVQSSEGFENSLNRFFAWCETSPICGFEGGRPAFDRLLADTAARPLPAIASGDPRPVLQIDVQLGTVLPLYARQAWPLLGDALTLAQAGDGSLLLAISDAGRGRDENGDFVPGIDAFVQTSCVDLDYPTSPAAFEAVGQRAAVAAPFIGQNNNWTEAGPGYVCGAWPIEANDRYLGPFTYDRPGGAPALVIGNTADPATPISGARSLVSQLGRAQLLTMDGDGHTAYGGNSSCIDPAVDAYLETLTLPAPGTVCPQDLVVDPTPEELVGAGVLAAARRHGRTGLSGRERELLVRAEASR